MDPLELVRLPPLMARGEGRSEVVIGLIDGPVALEHPGLSEARIREVPSAARASCLRADSVACTHATFVAGMLVAKRGSPAPAICPGCTLSTRPIFAEATSGNQMPSADPEELATAIVESVGAGARLINLSVALIRPTPEGERKLVPADQWALAEDLCERDLRRPLCSVPAADLHNVGRFLGPVTGLSVVRRARHPQLVSQVYSRFPEETA